MDAALSPGRTTTRRPPFAFSAVTRVSFSDTDAQGVVYYGRYMPYFDLARVEYDRHLGMLQVGFQEFVMRALQVEYHAPARFDDLVEVFVRLARFGRSSANYEYVALRALDDQLLVTATQTLVLIDHEARTPVEIAEATRAPVRAFEGDNLVE